MAKPRLSGIMIGVCAAIGAVVAFHFTQDMAFGQQLLYCFPAGFVGGGLGLLLARFVTRKD